MSVVVVALGGNALLRRGDPLDVDIQRGNVKAAADALVELLGEHQLVLTHGNGPQVGLLALQNEAYRDAAPYPLDVLGAETEGMVGYLLELELGNRISPDRLATLLTQVVVDGDDPAFARPSKPVGPVYDEAPARRLAAERGWHVARDGAHWRRVVASPEPRRIVELEVVRLLVANGFVVICAGGGGIPVVEDERGRRGVEAVIDKDLAAAHLATAIGADGLLLLTDVDAVYDGWGAPSARPIGRISAPALRARRFAAGSMAPKVDAACRFVERGGGFAGIGALEDAARIAAWRAGTVVVAS